MRLLGAGSIGELGSQHVGTYQSIREAIISEYRFAHICHHLAKYASIATPDLRRFVYTRETPYVDFGEALKQKHQHNMVWLWTSVAAFSHEPPLPLLGSYHEGSTFSGRNLVLSFHAG